MKLKPFRKDGDCYYIGECLIAVHNKKHNHIIVISANSSNVTESTNTYHNGKYITEFETAKDFEEYFFVYLFQYFFVLINGEYLARWAYITYGNQKLFATSELFEPTDEESKTNYLVEDGAIFEGKHNILFSNEYSQYMKYEQIEPDSHYLFDGREYWSIDLLIESKKQRKAILSGSFHYMLSENGLMKIGGKYWRGNTFVMKPQYYYPHFAQYKHLKTHHEPCEELDNIYQLLDSPNQDSVNLGKLLLKQFHKQLKKKTNGIQRVQEVNDTAL